MDIALAGTELLSATSHVLLVLSELLQDAHKYIQRAVPEQRCDVIDNLNRMRRDYPLEIAQKEAARRVWVKARSREKLQYTVSDGIVARTEIPVEKVRERYGAPVELPKWTDTEALEGAVLMFTERAKQILGRDGHLEPFMFLKKNRGEGVTFLRLQMRDRAEKHIAIRQVAAFLVNMRVEWVIFVNEAWWVPVAELGGNARYAVDSENRRKAISAVGVNAEGRFFNMRVPFRRFGKEIIFEDGDQDSEPVNILLPILKAIGPTTKPQLSGA
jgi:hypothetical protein